MIERDAEYLKVIHQAPRLSWEARHALEGAAGPLEINVGGQPLLRGLSSAIGDMRDSAAVKRHLKDYHKGGTAVVEVEGFLPFGGEPVFSHVMRYRDGLLRVTSDIQLRGGTAVNRHLEVGSMELPGEFTEMLVLPPAAHSAEGSQPYARKLPAAPKDGSSIMVGHWHRQPLALVFRRKDGMRIEIGCGGDLWRWEQNMGYHPESGSMKILLGKTGLRVVREPLACCEEFLPEQRLWRFTHYIAWDKPVQQRSQGSIAVELPLNDAGTDSCPQRTGRLLQRELEQGGTGLHFNLDINTLRWRDLDCVVPSPLAYVSQLVLEKPCLGSDHLMRILKGIVRRLMECQGVASLTFSGLEALPCYQAAHTEKNHPQGVAHSGLWQFMDFAAWAAHTTRERFPIHFKAAEAAPDLPVFHRLGSGSDIHAL